MKKDILSMDLAELAAEIRAMGQPAYRAGQIFRSLCGRRRTSVPLFLA